jgi:integrase
VSKRELPVLDEVTSRHALGTPSGPKLATPHSPHFLEVSPAEKSVTICLPPVPATRKRGKCMSRRAGQNPSVRTRFNRTKGVHEYFFQYWIDVPGQEERRRATEVIGPAKSMTKSEAERKKLEFILNLKINANEYRIPSSRTFAHAVRHYREIFAPRMLRESTLSVADGHLKHHLETDWNDVPIEHIDIDAVNEWIWKKRRGGLSWVTIKNILRTMQRVLSCSSKDKKPPFSQQGLTIPERDKLQMKIENREAVSFSWAQAKRIAAEVYKLDVDDARKERYAMVFILAAAAGLRCGELFALRLNDIDFRAGTVRADESADQRTYKIGPCKNVAAYRTVLLADSEGREALAMLKRFLKGRRDPNALVFHSKRGSPLRETSVLNEILHPVLRALRLPQAGMHAFRHGCNRRWELSGMNPAVLRQQMGHSSATMTARYTGEIPLGQVRAAFSKGKLENMENGRSVRAVA